MSVTDIYGGISIQPLSKTGSGKMLRPEGPSGPSGPGSPCGPSGPGISSMS